MRVEVVSLPLPEFSPCFMLEIETGIDHVLAIREEELHPQPSPARSATTSWYKPRKRFCSHATPSSSRTFRSSGLHFSEWSSRSCDRIISLASASDTAL